MKNYTHQIQRFVLILTLPLLFLANFATAQIKESYPFQNEINAFKKADSVYRPKSGGTLFIGSSSIRKWTDLQNRFQHKTIIRRGVGGCELWQVNKYYLNKILLPYKPTKIFLYAGENDLASGKSAESVLLEFKKFWMAVRAKLPQTHIYYMSIKKSPSRIQFNPEIDEANSLICKFLKGKAKGHFVNMGDSISNSDGSADISLFESDHLHLNKLGYDRWEKVLRPLL